MAFEHKENTATVFNNEKKTADNQPDFTGRGKVGEELMDFAMSKLSRHFKISCKLEYSGGISLASPISYTLYPKVYYIALFSLLEVLFRLKLSLKL